MIILVERWLSQTNKSGQSVQIDRDTWKELDKAPDEPGELEDNSFSFIVKLYNCIKKIEDSETPTIDEIIDEKKIKVS